MAEKIGGTMLKRMDYTLFISLESVKHLGCVMDPLKISKN